MISIWVSSSVYIKQLALEEINGLSSNALQLSLTFGDNLGKSNVEQILINNLKDTYIRFESEPITFNNSNCEIILEYFTNSTDPKYPLIEGKSLSKDNIKNKEKVAVIGNKLKSEIYYKDNIQYINLFSEEYKVIGFVGNNKDGYWDNKIILPLTASPSIFETKLSGEIPFKIFVDNNNVNVLEQCKSLIDYINKDTGSLNISEIDKKDNVIINNFSNMGILNLALMISLIAILNMINISIYWYDDIRKEVGIRKAFGNTNYDIAKLIISQLLFTCIIGFIISMLIQFTLGIIIKNTENISFNITIENLIIGIVVSFIASILSSILPIYNAIKTEPIEIVKK